MQDGPVYFIGGTFGGGSSSGWTIAIITAVVTAFASLGVGFALEIAKRRLDRKALAATILAEIDTILRLFVQLRMEENFKSTLIEMRQHLEFSRPWVGVPSNALSFPITIYEKCADRVGTIGKDVGPDIVQFYNFLNGFRVSSRIAFSSGDLPLQGRIKSLEFAIDILSTERPKAKALQRKLQAIAEQWF